MSLLIKKVPGLGMKCVVRQELPSTLRPWTNQTFVPQHWNNGTKGWGMSTAKIMSVRPNNTGQRKCIPNHTHWECLVHISRVFTKIQESSLDGHRSESYNVRFELKKNACGTKNAYGNFSVNVLGKLCFREWTVHELSVALKCTE